MASSVYNALVNSNMSYAISVWGANHSNLNQLFIIQKKCLRNLYSIKRISKHIPGHTKDIFNDNKILTIYNLYYYFTFLEIFKLKFYNTPEYLRDSLNIKPDNDRIILPKLSSSHYQNNFLHQGPRIWNLIIAKYRCLNISFTPKQVKRKIKEILLQMQSYSTINHTSDWLPVNNNIETYINQIKNDPYYTK